jgi:Tol biopolymer transport system component
MPSEGANEGNSRLDSWKEIAAYLNRDVRTVQRWEKTANLPVRRLQNPGLRAVFAYTAELDDWLRHQSPPATEQDSEAPAVETPPASSHLRRWFPYAGLAVLLVVAVAFAVRRPRAPFGPLTARPITSDPGTERDPDISPDGLYVAYTAVPPDLHRRLQVRLIEGGEPRALTSGRDNDWSPAWSPDGARIAFLRGEPDGNATLLLIPPLGGEERKLSDVRPYTRRRTLMVGHLLAWTPDGRHIVVPDRLTDGKGSLILIDAETGARTQLTSPAQAEYDVEPSLSSDGRILLFNRIRGEYLSDVFVQRLDSAFRPSGPPRKLPPAGNWNGTPRLLEDRGEVLVCAGTLPRLSLWRQPADGSGKPVSLGIIGDSAVQSAVHRRTGRIVFRTFRAPFEVLRFPLPTAAAQTRQEPQMQGFLESTFLQRSAVYSPDGTQVAFISDRTGRRQLWVSDSSGQSPVEWTQKFEVDLPPPAWSSDGSRIVFTGAGPSGFSQLFVADRATRSAVRLTDDALDYTRAVWSHDGKYLFAAAADKSVYAVYRLPSAGGSPEKILPEYRYVAGVEPSGQGLYLARRHRRDRSELDYVPLPAGPAVHLATLNFADDTWVTGEGIYHLARRGDDTLSPVALCFRTHAGALKLLQEYSTPPGRGLTVSADGRFALTSRATAPISDLMLLQIAK